MIDLDRMDQQLALARGDCRPSVPVPVLVERGHLDQADRAIAATTDECDAATWTTMRALLDGRRSDARAGLVTMGRLAAASDDPGTWDRYWMQRFWCAVEWGDEHERYEVVDHCRERAYRFGDLPWWGALTVMLSELGRLDEAARAFDETSGMLGAVTKDAAWLDGLTNLIEAAATMGDVARARLAYRSFDWTTGSLVLVGPALVCKGSVERYRALGLVAAGRPVEARVCFRMAADTHRRLGAGPLLDRTHRQAERSARAA